MACLLAGTVPYVGAAAGTPRGLALRTHSEEIFAAGGFSPGDTSLQIEAESPAQLGAASASDVKPVVVEKKW